MYRYFLTFCGKFLIDFEGLYVVKKVIFFFIKF